MKKLLLFFVLLFFAPHLARAANDHLLINQVQTTGGPGHTADDFVEIYNPTAAPIDLQGYRLVKRTQTAASDTLIKSWTDSTVVPAGGYYLWANSGYTDIPVAADVATSVTIADDNGIALRNGPNDTGTVVDSVAWGSAANAFVEGSVFPTNPTVGQVLARTNAADTDDNSTDFTLGTPAPHNLSMSPAVADPGSDPASTDTSSNSNGSGAVGTTGTDTSTDSTPAGGGGNPTYSNSILISEFLPNPDGPDDGEEWIELYNDSASTVDLSNWILDDSGKDASIGSSAYSLPSGSVISGSSYLAIDLPDKSFALNNTGGDTVRLFHPDQLLATQVSYTGNAAVDTTYARKPDGTYAWTFATKASANLFGLVSSQDVLQPTVDPGSFGQIVLNEIFPNPVGPDSGQEWVEVKNTGSASVTMHGWILDDGEKDSAIGSSAYTIQSPTLPPGGVAVIQIPSGKFAMNNSGTETVRLFSPDHLLADSVTYSGAKEGASYSKVGDGWAWADPTPNVENSNLDLPSDIVINEAFPYPSKGGEEFIELRNVSDKSVDLSGWKLKDQNSSYTIPNQTLVAGDFLVITRSQSGIALANTAKENLQLVRASGTVASAVEYEDAPKDQSFSRTDDGDFVWTPYVTSGAANKFGSGKVSAATLVRTGNPDPTQDNSVFFLFAGAAIIWYIVGRLLNIFTLPPALPHEKGKEF